VEEQIGQMLTDIAKKAESTVQRPLRRGQKRNAEISAGETSEDRKRYHITGYHGERDDKVRQDRRLYKTRGTKQEGYILTLRSTHMSRTGTIQMAEQEETQTQGHADVEEHTLDCLSTDKDDQDLWKTLVDF
jgi:hypothetical protein